MTAGTGGDGRARRCRDWPVCSARTVELARIPAPTGAEGDRARAVRRWWDDDGWPTSVDAAGNVWARAAGGPGPALLVAAHLDTVFPAAVSPTRLSPPLAG